MPFHILLIAVDVSTLTKMIPGLKASMEGSCPDERESKRARLRAQMRERARERDLERGMSRLLTLGAKLELIY